MGVNNICFTSGTSDKSVPGGGCCVSTSVCNFYIWLIPSTCRLMKTFILFVSKMLNPALKNLSEEDSAGSDPESGLGLEPETDRFGFIVTSRSTAGWGTSYCYYYIIVVGRDIQPVKISSDLVMTKALWSFFFYRFVFVKLVIIALNLVHCFKKTSCIRYFVQNFYATLVSGVFVDLDLGRSQRMSKTIIKKIL